MGLAICASLVACGGAKKPAADPTATPAADESENTKWDSSSESADNARRAKNLSASAKRDDSNDNTTSTASTSEPTTPSAPPKQRRSDEYDKEATEVVLKRAARQVKGNCGAATDEDGKASGPWGAAKMMLVLGHNGHMKEVSIGAPFDGKPTGRCATQAFKLLTYPPWAGSDMTIDYPVDIVPPGGDAKKK
ncbi:MAG: hypothetical protein U0235_25060 [Polyangiaceae bacterium]